MTHGVSSSGLPFAMGEGRLLEALHDNLSEKLEPEDINEILDNLRSDLYYNIGQDSLRDLHSVTVNCRRCKDVQPEPKLPEWNYKDPDVVFVAESPVIAQDSITLLMKSLKESGFSSKHVCLTYVNRCPATDKYSPESVNNCSSFLFTEVQLLQPKLTVAMGLKPTSVLLGSDSLKLGDERGNIHWLGPWCIMPTYAPGYAIRGNKELDFISDLSVAYQFVYGDGEPNGTE